MENPIRQTDINALSADVERLKKDLAKALEHLKAGAVHSATDLAENVSDEAAEIYAALAKRSDRAAKVLGKHVEEQPITSLLVAFTVGFFLSRLTDRR